MLRGLTLEADSIWHTTLLVSLLSAVVSLGEREDTQTSSGTMSPQ